VVFKNDKWSYCIGRFWWNAVVIKNKTGPFEWCSQIFETDNHFLETTILSPDHIWIQLCVDTNQHFSLLMLIHAMTNHSGTWRTTFGRVTWLDTLEIIVFEGPVLDSVATRDATFDVITSDLMFSDTFLMFTLRIWCWKQFSYCKQKFYNFLPFFKDVLQVYWPSLVKVVIWLCVLANTTVFCSKWESFLFGKQWWLLIIALRVVRICEIKRRRTTDQRFKPILRAVSALV